MKTYDLSFYLKLQGAPNVLKRFGVAHPEVVSRRLGGGPTPGDRVFALTDAVEFGPYRWTGGWPAFQALWQDWTTQWPTVTATLEVLGPSIGAESDDDYGVTTMTWSRGRDTHVTFSDDPDEIAAYEWTMRTGGPGADDLWAAALSDTIGLDALETTETEAESSVPLADVGRPAVPVDPNAVYESQVHDRQDLADQDLNPIPLPEEPEEWDFPDEAFDEPPQPENDASEGDESLPDDLPF